MFPDNDAGTGDKRAFRQARPGKPTHPALAPVSHDRVNAREDSSVSVNSSPVGSAGSCTPLRAFPRLAPGLANIQLDRR